jgi:hypothetical protein
MTLRRFWDMSQNFIACDRGQTMLMPPDLSEWVPDDHVVWSILGAVEQMDLTGSGRRIGWVLRVERRLTRR